MVPAPFEASAHQVSPAKERPGLPKRVPASISNLSLSKSNPGIGYSQERPAIANVSSKVSRSLTNDACFEDMSGAVERALTPAAHEYFLRIVQVAQSELEKLLIFKMANCFEMDSVAPRIAASPGNKIGNTFETEAHLLPNPQLSTQLIGACGNRAKQGMITKHMAQMLARILLDFGRFSDTVLRWEKQSPDSAGHRRLEEMSGFGHYNATSMTPFITDIEAKAAGAADAKALVDRLERQDKQNTVLEAKYEVVAKELREGKRSFLRERAVWQERVNRLLAALPDHKERANYQHDVLFFEEGATRDSEEEIKTRHHAEIDRLKDMYQAELAGLRDELACLRERDRKNSDSGESIDSLKKALHKAEDRFAEMQDTIKELRDSNTDFKDEIQALEEMNRTLRESRQNHEDKVKKLQEKLAHFQKQAEDRKSIEVQTDGMVTISQEEMSRMQQELHEAHKQAHVLKNRVEELQAEPASASKDDFAELQAELLAARSLASELTVQNAELINKIDTLGAESECQASEFAALKAAREQEVLDSARQLEAVQAAAEAATASAQEAQDRSKRLPRQSQAVQTDESGARQPPEALPQCHPEEPSENVRRASDEEFSSIPTQSLGRKSRASLGGGWMHSRATGSRSLTATLSKSFLLIEGLESMPMEAGLVCVASRKSLSPADHRKSVTTMPCYISEKSLAPSSTVRTPSPTQPFNAEVHGMPLGWVPGTSCDSIGLEDDIVAPPAQSGERRVLMPFSMPASGGADQPIGVPVAEHLRLSREEDMRLAYGGGFNATCYESGGWRPFAATSATVSTAAPSRPLSASAISLPTRPQSAGSARPTRPHSASGASKHVPSYSATPIATGASPISVDTSLSSAGGVRRQRPDSVEARGAGSCGLRIPTTTSSAITTTPLGALENVVDVANVASKSGVLRAGRPRSVAVARSAAHLPELGRKNPR